MFDLGIKLFGWQSQYLEKICALRYQETKAQQGWQVALNLNVNLGRITPVLASLATFLTVYFRNEPMNIEVIFGAVEGKFDEQNFRALSDAIF